MYTEKKLGNQLNGITQALELSNLNQGRPRTSDETWLEASIIRDEIDHKRPHTAFVETFAKLYNSSPVNPGTVNLEKFFNGLYPQGEFLMITIYGDLDFCRIGEVPSDIDDFKGFVPAHTIIDPALHNKRVGTTPERNLHRHYLVVHVWAENPYLQSLENGIYTPRAVLAKNSGHIVVLYDHIDPATNEETLRAIKDLIGKQYVIMGEEAESLITPLPRGLPKSKLIYFNPKF